MRGQPLTPEEVLEELRRERKYLVNQAHRDLAGALKDIRALQEQLELADGGEEYFRLPVRSPDMTTVRAAFDAIERIAVIDRGLGDLTVVNDLDDVPSFASDEEAARFWQTHQLGPKLLDRMRRLN